ncbi:hypothetical protein, partial [Petrachloros mirabilis]
AATCFDCATLYSFLRPQRTQRGKGDSSAYCTFSHGLGLSMYEARGDQAARLPRHFVAGGEKGWMAWRLWGNGS